ncbi:spermidine synthase [Saccharopolyspora sp. CA-218241]|uniref:spermidine synthase n=1 Tax=Saccharopolyspora sp. CA-218241 TaxID=3240027 RepID=UPI003D98A79B
MSGHLACARSERGDVALLRRAGDGALELRVNGVFVMDTAHTGTERLLATAALDVALPGRTGGRVLVGGLGLGFTLLEVLADPRVGSAHVVELEGALVDWHRRGLVPGTAEALDDERVRTSVGDVAEVLAAEPEGELDVLLLDVDNGPGHLVHDRNAALYRAEFLELCAARLAPGGTAAIWSAAEAPDLAEALAAAFGDCALTSVPVVLGRTETSYHLYTARRAR